MAIKGGEYSSIRDKEQAARLLLEHMQKLKELASEFREEYDLDINQILSAPVKSGESIPLSVFRTKRLSCLEIIVKFLKENRGKSYHEAAVLLNRNDRTIWTTYRNSLLKHKAQLGQDKDSVMVPLSIFSSRKQSILESLVIYLKGQLGFSFSKISGLLLKDYQTIYTTYRRGMSKNER
ncbi:hypothetical protein JXC34_03760 [Candidatus Woesearchaeota archaeon]|nr:hypothetical protein [Candidatus Woesearchaeota archaeon]